MASTTISDLTLASSVADTDVLLVEDSINTKKTTKKILLSGCSKEGHTHSFNELTDKPTTIDGEDGATFTPSVDSKGNLSWSNNKGLTNPTTVNIKGNKGDTGEQGIQGEQGEKGDTGVGVKSITSTNNTADGGTSVITVTLTDGSESTFNVKNGSKGSTGIQGEKGEPGAKGDKGDQGIQGKQGIQGEKGEKGDKGDKGDKGNDGLTTAISVNGNTYSHSNGTITLPNYPTDNSAKITELESIIASLQETIADLTTRLEALETSTGE